MMQKLTTCEDVTLYQNDLEPVYYSLTSIYSSRCVLKNTKVLLCIFELYIIAKLGLAYIF